MMNERRKSERAAINRPIIYMVTDSNGQADTQGIGLALDISDDGMMFESTEPIEAAMLSIQASINSGGTMTVEGFLVYTMPYSDGKYRSGLRFNGPPDQISSFVAEMRNTPR
jgi:hypothetical protein